MDTKSKAVIFALAIGFGFVQLISAMFVSDGEKLNIMLERGDISYDTVIGTEDFQSCETDACLEKAIRKQINKQWAITGARG